MGGRRAKQEWVSKLRIGGIGNGASNNPVISDAGEFVLFDSRPTTCARRSGQPATPTASSDVFLWNRPSGNVSLESRNAGNGYLELASQHPATSSRGNYVPFESANPDIDPSVAMARSAAAGGPGRSRPDRPRRDRPHRAHRRGPRPRRPGPGAGAGLRQVPRARNSAVSVLLRPATRAPATSGVDARPPALYVGSPFMGKTLVVAEKPSVGRDIAAALPGTFKQAKDKTHLVGRRLRDHLGGRAPRRPRRARRLRPEAEEVALRGPADRAREVQARPQRRAGREAAEGDPPADGATTRSSGS